MPSYSSQLMLDEARARGWQAEMVAEGYSPLIAVTPPDGRTYYMHSCVTNTSSAVGFAVNQNKLATYKVAERLGIPVAPYLMYNHTDTAAAEVFLAVQRAAGHELVVKPIDRDHGNGVSVGIIDTAGLRAALAHALGFSHKVIVQRRYPGDDCRLAVVDGQCVAAVRRTPPVVVGDGEHTIEQLVEIKNQDPRRDTGNRAQMRLIALPGVERFIGKEGLSRVPKQDEHVPVLGTANVSKGGEAEDITDDIHPSYKEAAVRIANALDLGVCGVDFVCSDITVPLSADVAALIEINCAIGLRLHHMPSKGKPRNVAGAILDAFVKYNNLGISKAVHTAVEQVG